MPSKKPAATKSARWKPVQPQRRVRAATETATEKADSDLVEDQLQRYRSMRDFDLTAEPQGATGIAQSKHQNSSPQPLISHLPFVIQKHAATRLHYDFRLGWNGVLKSWAVAKGPSYCTKDKRLAVQVEDHPIEYGGFEGIIPKGQYGGGTVMLWDNGTWEPQPGYPDVDAGLREGSLKFILNGTKMKGKWALIRMGGKAANESKPNWLLIKEHDEYERSEGDQNITEEKPESVITGRSLDEIASNQDHIWNSNRTKGQDPDLQPGTESWRVNESHQRGKTGQKKTARLPAGAKGKAADSKASNGRAGARAIDKYSKEDLPGFISPQLAIQAATPPGGRDWVYELKLDGYRIEARKDGAKVQLFTRTGLDWTHRMRTIADEVRKLTADKLILDGEVVVLSSSGTTSFADLQASFREGVKHQLTYFTFDLLHLDGHNLRAAELIHRKEILEQLLSESKTSPEVLRLSEHLSSDGSEIFKRACELGAEGILCKRIGGKYTAGRTGDWVKVKCVHEQEFVVGGYTLPSNGIHGIGALLLGYYDDEGQLIYAGRTGTGFNARSHKLIRDLVEKLRIKSTPFASVPAEARRDGRWVSPSLVAQVSFATWTADGLVRQAAFKGLREDKRAQDVRREEVNQLSAGDKSAANDDEAEAHSSLTEKVVARGSTTRKGGKPEQRIGQLSDDHQRPVRLTHPDKIVDVESQLTKRQLADYYWAIADHILPQIANRPLSLVRCPGGSTKPCFFQKHVNRMLPKEIETVEVPDKKTGEIEPYITVSTRVALAGLAQLGVLEVHPWGSKNDDLERPDRIVLDLDPDEAISWATLAASAQQVRELMESLGLKCFLKVTGGKGLHLVVPITPEHEWPVIKQFAHAIATYLERKEPKLYLSKMSKMARKDRIYVDYLRNERGATAVAPFSPRARSGVTVSVPLDWKELSSSERPVFRVADFGSWKKRLSKDPWKSLSTTLQRIDPQKVSDVLGS